MTRTIVLLVLQIAWPCWLFRNWSGGISRGSAVWLGNGPRPGPMSEVVSLGVWLVGVWAIFALVR